MGHSGMAMGGKILMALMTFMTIGAFIQLATLGKLEQEREDTLSRRMAKEVGESVASEGQGTSAGGVPASVRPAWAGDEDSKMLRVGLLKQEVLSWKPRVILFHDFLSQEEADRIIEIGLPRLEKSTVVDQDTGQGVLSKVRTSDGMFMEDSDRKDPIIAAIEKRMAYYTMIPYENGEQLQVLRYSHGQFYIPHHDWFDDPFNLKRGGQRVATILMYLSDVEEGGETFFPSAEPGGMCSCGGEMVKGICVKPKKGNAVLFWSVTLDGKPDDLSLHGGCKVVKGVKWSSTKWLRESVFE